MTVSLFLIHFFFLLKTTLVESLWHKVPGTAALSKCLKMGFMWLCPLTLISHWQHMKRHWLYTYITNYGYPSHHSLKWWTSVTNLSGWSPERISSYFCILFISSSILLQIRRVIKLLEHLCKSSANKPSKEYGNTLTSRSHHPNN